MLNAIIHWSLGHRFLVIVFTLLLIVGGALSLSRLPIDAFPDTTPVQVQINTTAPALSPLEIEQQITFEVEQAIGGIPGLAEVRSLSKFGLSQVIVTFEDGVDIYFARQLIMERPHVRQCRAATVFRPIARSRGIPGPAHRAPWPGGVARARGGSR